MLDCVIDLSHHNGYVDFVQAQEAGIVGVIHKATQGISFMDDLYASNRLAATSAGLLWGAYHFGVGNVDGVAQAEYFLEVAQPEADTLLALDYEPNPGGPTMTLDEAARFVLYVAARTHRFPGLYSGHLIKEQLGTVTPPDPVFARCFLWLAQYGPACTDIPPTWPTWTLWQYCDNADVPGIGPCDRNRFNGSRTQLARLWGHPLRSTS